MNNFLFSKKPLPTPCKVFLFIFILFNTNTSVAQCFASSSLEGTTTSNDNSVGSLNFTNTPDAIGSDDNRATSTAVVALFTGNSHYIKVTGFGFTIPSYASICGIKVDIEKRAQGIVIGAWIRDNEVKLVKANSVTGTNLAVTGNWGTSDGITTYGDATNLWGNTLTPADVNASDFGVAISAKFNGLIGIFPSAQIDNVRMTVYYNPILPLKIISFTSSLINNNVILHWRTTDEMDGEFITLQRSDNAGATWKDIARFSSSQYNLTHEARYTDCLLKKGSYAYRLQVTNTGMQHDYSEIKNVVYDVDDNNPILFPNPASDIITITNLVQTENIIISNIMMKPINMPIHIVDNHTVKLNTGRLKPGLYLVNAGGQKTKFIKQ